MIVLKVYYKGSSRPERHQFTDLPVTIGRSIKNQVVIDDTSVSVQHAVIDRNEAGLFCRDLDSTNGLVFNNKRIHEILINSNKTLQLGEVQVDLLVDDEVLEVTREVPLQVLNTLREKQSGFKQNWKIVLATLAILVAAAATKFYAHLGLNNKSSELIKQGLGYLMFCGIIATVLAIFSKIQSRRYRIFIFLPIVMSAFTVLLLFETLADSLLFVFESFIIKEALVYLFVFGFFYFYGLRTFHAIFPMIPLQRLKIWVAGGVVSLILFLTALGYVVEMDGENFDYEGQIGYPIFSFALKKNRFNNVFNDLDKSAERIQRFRQEAQIEQRN